MDVNTKTGTVKLIKRETDRIAEVGNLLAVYARHASGDQKSKADAAAKAIEAFRESLVPVSKDGEG